MNTILTRAVGNNDLESVKFSIGSGADIHHEDELALRNACYLGYLDIVECLVENGADIHVRDDKALRDASFGGHTDVIKYLKDVMKKEKTTTIPIDSNLFIEL